MKQKFYWGNSVSSMQTEGGWNEGGKSLSVYDIREPEEEKSDWHFANDNYHHFDEDLDLIQELGMNMYRFQISWSRAVKDGDGEFNEEGLAYYDRFIDALIERGIEPMICLYHFDMPLHLAEAYNGFLSKHTAEAFVRYGKKMADRYAHKVKYWITFNEQNLYSTPYAFTIGGAMTAEQSEENLFRIMHNIMYCHCAVANYIHETTDAKIGGMLAYAESYPFTCRPEDIKAARTVDEFMNYNLIDVFTQGTYSDMVTAYVRNNGIDMGMTEEEAAEMKKCTSDYIAFSYYQSSAIDSTKIPEGTSPTKYNAFGRVENPYIGTSDFGWQIDALGFRDVLNKIWHRYHVPVFPIENGIGMREVWDGEHMIEDDYRIAYHRDHIQAMKDAMEEDGVKCLGYLGWGLIDILSSQGNMEKRYGVVYVNRGNHDLRDMKRVKKKSFAWLQHVIQTNGEEL